MTKATVPGYVNVAICDDCQRLDSGGRTLCPGCRGSSLRRTAVLGRGKVRTWTVIRKPPLQFSDEDSYVVALIALDAGVQIVARLLEDPEDISAGLPVQLVSTNNPEIITFERTH